MARKLLVLEAEKCPDAVLLEPEGLVALAHLHQIPTASGQVLLEVRHPAVDPPTI